MALQDLNAALAAGDVPTSTARLLQSIIRPSSTNPLGRNTASLGAEQATAIIRALLITSLDNFFDIYQWSTPQQVQKEKEMCETTGEVFVYTITNEITRTPTLLIRRFPEYKDLPDLCRRANGVTPQTQTCDQSDSPVELEEELSIWSLVRLIYCAALVRDASTTQISDARWTTRIQFIHRVEAAAKSIHYHVFCSADREMRNIKPARATDFAKIFTTINEEIRSMLMGWIESTRSDGSADHLGCIELLGDDRRTQIPASEGRVNSLQLEQRPFTIPIFSRSIATNILLTSLRIQFCILHHSVYFLDTIPSAVEALVTLWEYTIASFPTAHNQRMLESLIELLGWFFEEPTGPQQLISTTKPCEDLNYLACYIKSRSPVSLDKICSTIINTTGQLFATGVLTNQDEPVDQSHSFILLLLKILRWLADEDGRMAMSQTSRSIHRLVVKYGKFMIAELLSNSETALNVANPDLKMISLSLLCCPMDTFLGRPKFSHNSLETYATYELLDRASINQFESLLFNFTPRWTQQIMAQEYCAKLGRSLHWLSQSLQVIQTRLTSPKKQTPARKRKRIDSEVVNVSDPLRSSVHEVGAIASRVRSPANDNQTNTHNDIIPPPTFLHNGIGSLLKSCSTVSEVPQDLGRNSLTSILLKSFERITTLILPIKEADAEAQKRLFHRAEREFDLLGSLICTSALGHDVSLSSNYSEDLSCLLRDEVKSLFQCLSCDRCHLDAIDPNLPELKVLPRCIFTGAIMLCHNSSLLAYPSMKRSKMGQDEKLTADAKSGTRLSFLRFLTRVLNHTVVDVSQTNESPMISTPEVNQSILTVLELGSRLERIAAGRILASLISNSLDLFRVRHAGQLSDCQLEPLLAQLERLADHGCLRIQETLVITLILCFELTRTIDMELIDQERVELNCCISQRIWTILLRQMCRRNSYLLAVIKTEVAFLSRRTGVSVYTSLAHYLPSLSQFMAIKLKFHSHGSGLMADLLGMSLEVFLIQTARYTLPLLVLDSHETMIKAIARAKEESVPQLLVSHATDIITHLCLQNTTKALRKGAETLYRFLNAGSGHSSHTEQTKIGIGALIELSAGLIYYRLIVDVAHESDRARGPENVKVALRKALQLMKSPPNWNQIPSDQEIQQELRSRALPILSQINAALQDLRGKISMSQKIKVMHGLGDLISLIDSTVSSYIPQIMASLHASLIIPALRSATMQTFHIFVKATAVKDLKPFVGQITAAIHSIWPQMNAEQLTESISILQHILRHRQDLGHYAFDIADLSGLSVSAVPLEEFPRVHSTLVDIIQEQASFKKGLTWTGKLKNLIDRINSESEVVIRQSLKELTTFLATDRDKIKLLMAGDTFDPLIGNLVKVLIGVTTRCNDSSDDIKSLAFECLGTVGAVDPDRCEISEEKTEMVLASNFADHDESVNFVLHLLQDELVGAYRSTNDSKHHNFLTYAIQELLRFCGFTQDLLDPKRVNSVSSLVKKKWNSMPKHILDSISPLLGSKFKFSVTRNSTYNAPVYNHTTVYSSWLKNWLLRLIHLVENQEASNIFLPFLGVIRHGDTVISQKLIPHIALHIVISGASEEVENIKLEIVTALEDQVDRRSGFSPEGRQLVAQTIFSLMDHFSRWIRDTQNGISVNETAASKRKDNKSDSATARVKSIMTQISQELIASAALYCKDHARALLNFEQQILKLEGDQTASKNSLTTDDSTDEIALEEQLQNYYERAHEIYAAIDEPDGMEGISAKIIAPSILHQIREHESTGRWTSAQSCWEVELQRQPDELRSHLGLLRCLRNLGHYDSLRAHIVGVLQSHPDWEKALAPFSVESSLVSNNWEGLTRAVQVGSMESPEVIFGKVVDMLLNTDEPSFDEAMKDARVRLGNQIFGASRKDAYKRMYDTVIYLHILHELPLIDQACCEASSAPQHPKLRTRAGLTIGRHLMDHLDFRLESISPAFRYREQLLRLRRATFQLRSRGAPAVGQLWVQTAKIARKAGHLQTAYSAVLQASELKAPTAFIQQAKLMKLEDQPFKAVLKLDDNLKKSPLPIITDGSFDRLSELSPRDYAKASLQRVRWMNEIDRYPTNHIVEHFERLCQENPSWASSYYYFGRFYDERASQAVPGTRTSQNRIAVAEYTFHCCRNFQKSLTFGTKFIYQALPRLLTMYFSFGEHPDLLEIFKTVEKKKRAEIRHEDYTQALRSDELGVVFLRVDKVIHNAVKKLPVFEWLTVLPQVVSRVMHKSTHVQAIVHKILTHVLRSYPDQALWAMVSGVESSNTARSSRCSWVLQDATDVSNGSKTQLEPLNLARKIEQCRKLVKQLLKLCNFTIKNNTRHLSLNDVFPALQQCTPCDLIIPAQHSLIASLPPNDVNFANHQPFPSDLPLINSFADKISIMNSLQKPRKIGIIGSDGKEYPFLCKPKDDLRKDARLMEFNSMINKLLKKDSESRKRHLHIRTYAVVVLNEECGLLEWVPNTVTFRNILAGLYHAKGIAIWNGEIKAFSDKIRKHRDDWDKVKQIFENEVLSKFPSVFHQWFLNNFPDPTSWLRSRQAYGRTCAVMSMVGFVLGLGDRHGENILFDATTGDVVHVDFNCLFDKGRTFEVSENVPFRLTHNLVSGLGITGVEGVFRRASEVTMGILRNNKDSLMSVLETFVHDPLVDWMPSVSKRKGVDAPTEEYVAREAKKCLEPISRKLTGFQITSSLSGKIDRQTSTENQVDSLINEARDNRHLGRMYFGWAPYL